MPIAKIVKWDGKGVMIGIRRVFNETKGIYEYLEKPIPKDGYWKVVWSRKPRDSEKDITGFVSKKEAEWIEDVLNSLSMPVARSLVVKLQSQGKTLERDHNMKKPRIARLRY